MSLASPSPEVFLMLLLQTNDSMSAKARPKCCHFWAKLLSLREEWFRARAASPLTSRQASPVDSHLCCRDLEEFPACLLHWLPDFSLHVLTHLLDQREMFPFGFKSTVQRKWRNLFRRACPTPSVWPLHILWEQWQRWKHGCPELVPPSLEWLEKIPSFGETAVPITWLQLNTEQRRETRLVPCSDFQFSPHLHYYLAEGWAKLQPPWATPVTHDSQEADEDVKPTAPTQRGKWPLVLHHPSATTLQGLSLGSRAGVSPTAVLESEEILKPTYLSLPPLDLDWGLHSNFHGSVQFPC